MGSLLPQVVLPAAKTQGLDCDWCVHVSGSLCPAVLLAVLTQDPTAAAW